MKDLLEFLEDSPRGFPWAAARHMRLKALPGPHCSALQFTNAQAQAVVPALPANGHQAVQEQCGDVSNLKAFALSVSTAVMSLLWNCAQPFWGIYLLQNRTWTWVSLIKSCDIHTSKVAQQMPSAFDNVNPKIAHAAAVWANCFSFWCL